jgi:DNA adenine methylase
MFKWVGSKRRLVDDIMAYMPSTTPHYFEPFFGAGHVGLTMLERGMISRVAHFSDANQDLMSFWLALQNSPEDLWKELQKLSARQNKKAFLEIRDRRKDDVTQMGARFYYLVMTDFRGLWRVNSEGRFNVGYGGDFKREDFMPNEAEFNKLHRLLDSKKVILEIKDFKEALDIRTPQLGECTIHQAVVYLDPPYFNTFDAYQVDRFGRHEHVVLNYLFEKLKSRGARVIESNSDSPFIRDLYRKNEVHEVNIVHNANVLGPQPVKELIIT